MKKMLIIISITVILIFVIFTYGWRLFGFTFCDNPDSVLVTYVELDEDQYEISFITSSSYMDFKGANYEYKDGVLYVGAKYGYSIFGDANGTGKIIVEVDGDFSKIVVKGSGDEREINLITEE